jgi:TolA-binding protein
MSFSGRVILLLLLGFWTVGSVWSASGAENQAFTAAEKLYLDAFYKEAETNFSDYIQKFPNSPRIPEAILFQAQARLKLGDYAGALNLLSAHQGQAGAFTDWYLLVQGEALLSKGDFAQAEANFSRLTREFPSSPRRLTAVVDAAVAQMRLSQWPKVTELLGYSNGVFQLTAATNHASPDVIRGFLLLSEAQLAQNDTHAAELSLQYLAASPLDATNNWQRQYLLCRVLFADGRLEQAMQSTTNLLILADATGQSSLQAQTTAFQAGLLERLDRKEDAVAAYEKNLSPAVPAQYQRQALLKITELSFSLGQSEQAAQVLQKFLSQFPTNECSDLALLTLGELHLRQCARDAMAYQAAVTVTNVQAATNLLEQAIAEFQSLGIRFPQSPLLGKAQLDLGWCYWLGGKIPESQRAFQSAVKLLPPSTEQARALFKLGDAQFLLTNYSAAISTYSGLVDRFAGVAEVRTNLTELALYQIVRAGQAADDLNSTTNALAKMLAWFPQGSNTVRAVLIAGQQLGERHPEAARTLYSDFARSATNSPLLPELELAIARTYEGEAKWDEAIQQYETWLTAFTNHQARGQAQYFLARAYYEAGNETNALLQFTNFLVTYPASQYAPLAQWWVGDYFFRAGNFPEAESNYKLIFQNTNWATLPIAYEARLMAGRAAVRREGWETAQTYFTNLWNDRTLSANLRSQALFAYGDTLLTQGSTNKALDYQHAFNAYDLICQTYPSNALAALAWGQKAICLLQFVQGSTNFDSTTNAFQQVLDSPLADARARSAAEVGLGVTLEKMAETRPDPERNELLNSALRHYQRVFYDNSFLREGEKPDPFWTRKAGLEAARLAASLQLREQAINVYRRLQDMFPALRLDDKIKALQD